VKGLKKTEKVLIGVLLVMLVGYICYQYLYIPLNKKIQTVQVNIDKYNEELMKTKLAEASNKKMTEEMGALKEKYDAYMKLMPKSDMSAEILREVNRVALVNNVTLGSITLADGAEYSIAAEGAKVSSGENNNKADAQNAETKASTVKVMAVPVAMNIKGDYNSVKAFINILESGGRIANISTINAAKQEKDTALTVTLNASLLYVQDGTETKNTYEFNNGIYSKYDPFK
jgi:Tfp pilus assembly protein PilO